MTTRRQELWKLLARAALGLSGVDYVIADTGTLVLMARADQMRGVSLLPPVHVAVARTSQVIATLADYLLLVQAAASDPQQYLTSCVSFVTGPSRTGDSELKRTVVRMGLENAIFWSWMTAMPKRGCPGVEALWQEIAQR